jgi:predicted Zn-dependent protease
VNSTQALKDMLGLRDVQSGNWVLKDPNSAKFHVEQTAGAMSDLADMLGIEVSALGLGGRLGMAFGADRIGVELAGRAGFDPGAAISLWEKMARASGNSTPQWLSTHPSNETRLADLKVYAERVQPLYVAARAKKK